MAYYEGNVAQMAKSPAVSVGHAWASVSASSSNPYQVLGVSAGCSNIAASVELIFGSTTQMKWLINASGASLSEWYGNLGPVTATNEAVILKTVAHAKVARPVSANLVYRIVL